VETKTREDWFDPTEDDGKSKPDEKAVVTATNVRGRVSKLMGKSLRPLRIRLAYTASQASAAATAMNAVINVEPSLSSEWSSLVAIYDECRVFGGEFVYSIGVNGANPIQGSRAVMVYDPVDLSILTSVAMGCEASQHKLVSVSNVLSSASAPPTAPAAMTNDGLWRLRFKVPGGKPARSASVTAVFSGEWSACVDATDVYGFIKPYIETQGAATTSALVYTMYLDVGFRSRT